MFVRNFSLNFGGVVGAVSCVIAVVAVNVCLNFPGAGATPLVLAAAAGGWLGNRIWRLALPSGIDDSPRI
jgi:hypothetical protein